MELASISNELDSLGYSNKLCLNIHIIFLIVNLLFHIAGIYDWLQCDTLPGDFWPHATVLILPF